MPRANRPLKDNQLRFERLESRYVLSNTIVVNTLNDVVDPDDGRTSLREAVEVANEKPDANRITFHPRLRGTISLSEGELAIEENVRIQGRVAPRLSISGSGASRIFNIAEDTRVAIANLTLKEGLADGDSPDIPSFGGAILNQGDLRLQHVVMANNQALGDKDTDYTVHGATTFAGVGFGGAVANLGKLSVYGSRFKGNLALGADSVERPNNEFPLGPAFVGNAHGGALGNLSEAHVRATRFIGNSAIAGSNGQGDFGAIAVGGAVTNDGFMRISESVFRENLALGGDEATSLFHNGHALGGAISSGSLLPVADPSEPGSSLHVKDSAFVLNVAQGGDNNNVLLPIENIPPADGPNNGYGGGILVYQGEAHLDTIRVNGNVAASGDGGVEQNGGLGVGGGIFFFNFLGGVTAKLRNSDISNNRAIGATGSDGGTGGDGIGGGVAVGSLGAPFGGPGDVQIMRTDFDRNRAIGGSGDGDGDAGNGRGGGIANVVGGITTVKDGNIWRNRAIAGAGDWGSGLGGGISNEAGGDLTLIRDDIFRNFADDWGGGIFNDGELSRDAFTRRNTYANRPDDVFQAIGNEYDAVGTVKFTNLQALLAEVTTPPAGDPEFNAVVPLKATQFSEFNGHALQTGSITATSLARPATEDDLNALQESLDTVGQSIDFDAFDAILTFSGVQGPNPFYGDRPLQIISGVGGQVHTTWVAQFFVFLDLANGEAVLSGDGDFTVVGGTGLNVHAGGEFLTIFITDPIPLTADSSEADYWQVGEINRLGS